MLTILYKDNDIVAVNKPSGLLSVPGKTEPTNLFEQVTNQFPNARVVHRLDMGTSGIILFALNYQAQKDLGKQFELRTVKKNYTAIVNGHVTQSCGDICAPLICDWNARPKQKVDWLEGKPAFTHFKVLEQYSNNQSTRVLLVPHTGRSHQLRVHMLQIGHPILGDNFYGNHISRNKSPRLLLHAQKINFHHPVSKQAIEIYCEPEF